MNSKDKTILRDLAQKYVEVCSQPIQDERRALWRQHNSLKQTRPLIYTRAFAWHEMPEAKCRCEDDFARQYEDWLRYQLFWSDLNDDSPFEPWITVQATRTCSGWGLAGKRQFGDEPGGSYKVDYPIKALEDITKLREPWHEIDEEKTVAHAAMLNDAVGDILTVNIDRGPEYRMWTGDIATDLGHLRGIEHLMIDMMDHPEWLHQLVSFMSKGILKTHQEAEDAGDWGLSAHQNQAMPYTEELEDPAANINGVRRSQLWYYAAAQELTGVSAAMHDEFLLKYQLPILEPFGLVAYGCCGDLTNKIDILRQIPNLRRIAVSPFADVRRCAQQIGKDYVLSYRPSPADMISFGYDEDRIRSIVKRDLEICRDTHVDITLKDVETVEKDPTRVKDWVVLTRRIIDEVYG